MTSSQAALTVTETLRKILRPTAFDELPKDLKHFYEESGHSKETITNKALVWPLKVLELLICNNEQAEMCLRRGSIVELIN